MIYILICDRLKNPLETFSFLSYVNVQTTEVKTIKYKNQEPAYVEQIKVLGNDLGNEELQKICIVLRIQVSNKMKQIDKFIFQ